MTSLVAVEFFVSPWDAYICRGLLESEGVPSFVVNEHHVSVNWVWSQALGQVRVCVPRDLEAEAREVLSARDGGEYEVALCEESGIAPTVCSLCGSRSFQHVRDLVERAVLVCITFTFGIVFPPKVTGQKCRKCGAVSPHAF